MSIKLKHLDVEYSPILDAEIYTIHGCPFVFTVEPEQVLCVEELKMKRTGKYQVTVAFYSMTSVQISKHKSRKLARKALLKRIQAMAESMLNALPEVKGYIQAKEDEA